MSSSRVLLVPEGLAGLRLDAALSRLLGVSRTRAAALVDAGAVSLEGVAARKADRLTPEALLEVEWPDEMAMTPPEPELSVDIPVIYSDSDIVVVDKPAGVAAHSSPGWQGPTVLGALAKAGYHIATSGVAERQGIVHRLDVGTSGLMVVAASEPAYAVLKQAFRDRTVAKVYYALAQGLIDPLRGTIDAPIGRHPKVEAKFAVRSSGKPSITHYEVIEAFRGLCLSRVHLETGRTHQIRVHFAAIGHPLVGDTMYGADPRLAERFKLDRQWLHAGKLGFTHPGTGKWVEFASDYPEDLTRVLDEVRNVLC